MLPAELLSFRVVEGEIVPDWLGPQDHPWLRDLLDRAEAATGKTLRELDRALADPGARPVPPRRLAMACHALRGRWSAALPEAEVPPRAARAAVFQASSELRVAGGWSRAEALERAAERLRVDPAALDRSLLLDLPGERRTALDEPLPSPAELALHTNLALAQGLVRRARQVTVTALGNSRDLVRHVRLRGLLCVARRVASGVELEISGPIALFRHTTLYGREQASVVPRLPWCERFALRAACLVRGSEAVLRLGTGDPIFPSDPPRRFDSRLEETFAKELARRHPDWDLVREPEPVDAGGVLVFPDFALFRRAKPEQRWFVEVVGFWTPEYLEAKLARLAAAAGRGWIVCVDERLNCGTGELSPAVTVVRFRRKLDPDRVLERLAEIPPLGGRRDVIGVGGWFVDWAGRKPPTDPVHQRLAELRPGSEATLERRGDGLVLVAGGGPVAALSARARELWAPRLPEVRSVKVREVLRRRRDQSGEAWRHLLRCPEWRVPLVDVWWG